MMELNENGQKVLKLLRNIPPDFTGAEEILVKEELSREEVSYIGYRYTSDCYEELLYNTDEIYDTVGAENIFGFYFYEPPVLKEGLHSTYLLDVMKLLYRYGMDPVWNLREVMFWDICLTYLMSMLGRTHLLISLRTEWIQNI